MEEGKEYVCVIQNIDGINVYVLLHELVLPPPEGYETYHINGNTFDCRRENLAIRKIKEPQN